MPEFTTTFVYPNQQLFKCPVCGLCFSIYSSWTRHSAREHSGTTIHQTFNCSACERTFESRRSVANHFTKTHGKPAEISRDCEEAGSHQCEFCNGNFPNKRSLSQHIRNQHATAASEQRAAQAAADSPTRRHLWTPEEHRLFLEAMTKFGPISNKIISRHIRSKTAKQVGMHKRIFLRDNPDWTTNLANSETVAVNIQVNTTPNEDSNSNNDNTSTALHHISDLNSSIPQPIYIPPETVNTSVQEGTQGLDNTSCQEESSDRSVIPSITASLVPSSLNVAAPEADLTTGTIYPQAATSPPPALTQPPPVLTCDRNTQNSTSTSSEQKSKDIMNICLQALQPLTDHCLSEEEWLSFESITEGLVSDLKAMLSKRSGTHPTTHWKKRQRRKPNQPTAQQEPHPTTDTSISHQWSIFYASSP